MVIRLASVPDNLIFGRASDYGGTVSSRVFRIKLMLISSLPYLEANKWLYTIYVQNIVLMY